MWRMKSLRYLYRIGKGPSSSHTIAPYRAIQYLMKKYKDIVKADVSLYGSFALTGKGHLTDVAIKEAFGDDVECNVVFDFKKEVDWPNTMDVELTFLDGHKLFKIVKSLGGGAVSISDEPEEVEEEVYPHEYFFQIAEFCKENNMTLVDYVRKYEGDEIFDYLHKCWDQMCKTIHEGLRASGTLPGRLKVQKRASSFLVPSHMKESSFSRGQRMIAAYAFATNEQNASGGIVVTAPTCGSSGTLPAVLMHLVDRYEFNDDKIVEALAVAGIIGNLIKQNGSISGAEAGCQAEIGSACSMAAAAASYLKGFTIDQIECAAEAAMEHSLGLTCDPVDGYVQVPCIERNAIAASKALTATYLAEYATSTHRADFDTIVYTMLKTGKDMNSKYRETAEGGLAETFKEFLEWQKEQENKEGKK